MQATRRCHQFAAFLIAAFLIIACNRIAIPQDQPKVPDTSTKSELDSEKQERIAAERFLELLKKRPRAGTALDKVYGYHVQNGSLDQFTESLRKEATDKSSGEAWMLLGMVQMQRGQDADASMAFEKAEVMLPKEPLVSYYLGKTLVLLGDVDRAAQALERAIERKPAKADMLVIFQELGRLYQRMRRSNDAAAVWSRMETFFPGDSQVQEQIAIVLAEEGDSEEALKRFEALAKSNKDRFRQLEMAVRAAQLKETVGRRDDALADFEKLLAQVNPDSWMYLDLRTRIDNVFLSRSDYDGLANYYNAWMEKHPDDIDAMLRIGRLLSVQRRLPEAKVWFTEAIKRTPTNPAPRMALIDALERDGEFAAAAESMKALSELQPDNPDYIVRWGELIFNDRNVEEKVRAQMAASVWKKLLDAKANDPVTVARVADLLRGANLTEEAIATYRKAISLADLEPQYREYLGEYLFRLNRKEEAFDVWQELASGPRENRDNMVRLSEVLASFQYRDEALATMKRVCDDKPTFGQRTRFAEMLRDAAQYEDSLKQLDLAKPLAESPQEMDLVVEQQIKVYQANGKLVERIAELETAVEGKEKENAKSWENLALYFEAARKFQQAAEAIGQAAKLDSKSIAVHTIASRVNEKAGMYTEALDSLRALMALDRRYMSNYLTQIATLQMRLGQSDAAIATGQELISAASANSEQFRFFADLCFQAGKPEQGLVALRRNMRSNPNDLDAVRHLARTLSSQFQSEEAIELYWRSFSLARTLEEKRADVEAMTELYLRTNRFDQFVNRLTTLGREANRTRETTLLVAAAHQSTGDLGAARALLEPLLREESRDADLLATLVKLAQAEFDWEAAATFQKRLNEVAPSPEGEFQLARFYVEQGELGQAQAIWSQQKGRFSASESLSQSLEKLVAKGERDRAIELAEQAIAREPDNWELSVSVMNLLWQAGNRDRAVAVAERLIRMNFPFETRSQAAIRQQAQAARSGANPSSAAQAQAMQRQMDPTSRTGWLSRLSRSSSFLLRSDDYRYSSSTLNTTPQLVCFGDAQAIARAVKIMNSVRPQNGTLVDTKTLESEIVASALASNKEDDLWNAIADLQSLQTATNLALGGMVAVPSVFSTASSATGNNVANLPDLPRTRVLTKLAELDDAEAASNLFTTYFSYRQSRVMPVTGQRAPSAGLPTPLTSDELAKVSKLYSQLQANTNTARITAAYTLWLSDEFRLAKDDAKADQFYAISRQNAEANPTNFNAFMTRDRSFAVKLYLAHLRDQNSRTAGISNTYFQTASLIVGVMEDANSPADVVAICTELKQQQSTIARKLRPSQLVNYDASKSINTNYSSVTSGGGSRTIRIQLDFPAASALQSQDLLVALRAVQQSTQVDCKAAVAKQLADDVAAADEDVLTSAIDRLCYASWLWWEGEQDEAIEQMREYNKLNVATELGLVIESRMLFESKQWDGALALLESVKPMNQQMLQDRELAILQLVLQKGDLERAKKSAERLFALRLNSNVQMQLGDLMNQLGMKEMADAVYKRARQRGGSDLSSQYALLLKFQTIGNKTAAAEIGRQVLRRTNPTGNTNSNVRTSEDAYRRAALQAIVAAGESKALIQSLETRLEKSPKSANLIRQLAELYDATGNRKASLELLARIAKSGSSDPLTLLNNARSLANSGKHAEAVKAYLEALNKQPEMLEREYYQIRQSVESAKKWKEFAEGIEKIGINRFRRTYRISEFISQLMQHREHDVAKRLVKSCISEAGPNGLSMALDLNSRISSRGNSQGKQLDLFDDEVSRMILDRFTESIPLLSSPSADSFVATRTTSVDGRALTLLSLLYGIVKTREPDRKVLLAEVQKLSDSCPRARIVEAVLVAATDDKNQLDELQSKIVAECQRADSQCTSWIWPLASVLVHECKAYQRGVDILTSNREKLANAPRNGNQMDYTPDGLLFYCYTQLKQNDKAKLLLDSIVANPVIDSSISINNPGYAESQKVQLFVSAAQKYIAISMPLEALRIAVRLRNDKPTLDVSANWIGDISYIKRQIDEIESTANRSFKPEMMAALAEEVLQVRENGKPDDQSILPTLLELRVNEAASEKPYTSVLDGLLSELHARSTGEEALNGLFTKNMQDPLSKRSLGQLIALASIASRVKNRDGHRALADEIVTRIESIEREQSDTRKVAIDVQPTTPPSDDKKVKVQEKAAAVALERAREIARIERCAVWLVAEQTRWLDSPDLTNKLALFALEGMDVSSPQGQQFRLRFVTNQIAQGRPQAEIEKVLRQLHDAFLKPRKEPPAAAQNTRAGLSVRPTSPSDDEPNSPKVAMDVALVAADAQLFDISYSLVKHFAAYEWIAVKPRIQSSLLGNQPPASSNFTISTNTGRRQLGTDEQREIQAKVFALVDKWKAKNAPKEDVISTVLDLVFPPNRDTEIVLQVEPGYREGDYDYNFHYANRKPQRVLAFELIEMCQESQGLSKLVEKLEGLKSQPAARANATAMLIFAKRTMGLPGEAAKLLDDLLSEAAPIDNVFPLYASLVCPIAYGGEKTQVSMEIAKPLLLKLLNQNMMRTDVKNAVLDQIRGCIAAGDNATLESWLAIVSDSIRKSPNTGQNTVPYLLATFFTRTAALCDAENRPEMAIDVLLAAERLTSESGQAVALDFKSLVILSKQSDVKLNAWLRKRMLSTPLVDLKSFGFVSMTSPNRSLLLFSEKLQESQLSRMSAYQGAGCISALDLLLNLAEKEHKLSDTAKALFGNVGENADVTRFLAIWLSLRHEKRGNPPNPEWLSSSKFDSAQEFCSWWKALPIPVAIEIAKIQIEAGNYLDELQEAIRQKVQEGSSRLFNEIDYRIKFKQAKGVVGSEKLKHWITTYEVSGYEWENAGQPRFSIDADNAVQSFGGVRGSYLLFRYPLPPGTTFSLSTQTAKPNFGLFGGGVSVGNSIDQDLLRFWQSGMRNLGLRFAAMDKYPCDVQLTLDNNAVTFKFGDSVAKASSIASRTAPFVGIHAFQESEWKLGNIKIEAPIPLPSQVEILAEGLNGWSAALFSQDVEHSHGQLDSHLRASTQTSYEESRPIRWRTADGQLRAGKGIEESNRYDGLATLATNPALSAQREVMLRQSLLSYIRPLGEGESIEYEYFHHGALRNVAPSIGRVAYIIHKGKVRLHWIISQAEQQVSQIPTDNISDDPAGEVLAPLSVIADEWNRVKVRIEGGKVVITIGGTDVYRRPFDEANGTQFGFFCDPSEDHVQVRNVVLKGSWPSQVPGDLWEAK
jgi:tetratricopeptide (TPR) repeat protein